MYIDMNIPNIECKDYFDFIHYFKYLKMSQNVNSSITILS